MAETLDLFAGLNEDAPAKKAKRARKAPRAGGGRRPKKSPSPPPVSNGDYTAHDIEILEGLEPVRRRPGMFIGGTDQRALHHLLAELVDNAMDEAIAGHASRIEIGLHGDGSASVKDNGRGIPVDPHPKYENVSALQVILTTLHSGGKFSDKVYATSGGLHGVGLSVVNALSESLTVRGRARQAAVAAVLRAGPPHRRAGRRRPRDQPARHAGALSTPTPRFSGRTSASSRGRSTRWRERAPTSTVGSRSAGPAMRRCYRVQALCRRRRSCTTRAVW